MNLEMYNTGHFILSITKAETLIVCIELAVFSILVWLLTTILLLFSIIFC
jgi:hypothetical protein